MRILFVASEGLPFSKTGGLADVVEALPKALVAQGHEVAVVLPCYRGTKATGVAVPSVTISLGGRLRFPAIADGGLISGVRYFFVVDPAYFDRAGLYGERGGDYPDNAERYSEFCRVAIEIAKNFWRADLIHCHDWQAALVAILLRTSYAADPVAQSLPVVFTIHNMGYHGQFPLSALGASDIPAAACNSGNIEFYGNVNLLKGGLVYSDYLTTVSRKYAQEIQTPEFGYGLDGVVRNRADRLVGIINGVDYSAWNPEKDKVIAAKYSAKDLSGKQVCKKALLELFDLPLEPLTRPLVGIVSRFADQKGFDLIAERAHELMQEEMTLIVLGTGERKYEDLFRSLAATYPQNDWRKDRLRRQNRSSNRSRRRYVSHAFALRALRLNQIYSLKYGTVPIVRATGGLDDTIESFDLENGTGTGFKFQEYSGTALVQSVRRALQLFEDERIWKRIQLNGMAKDFSWKGSATEYAKVYAAARASRNQLLVATSN